MAETLLLLLTAHLLGDFVFQSRRMVDGKREPKVMFLHVAIHLGTTFFLLGGFHPLAFLVLFGTHWSIDWIKTTYAEENANIFLLDQVAHLLVLIFAARLIPQAAVDGWWSSSVMRGDNGHGSLYLVFACVVCGVIVNTRAGGTFIGLLTAPLRAELRESGPTTEGSSVDQPADCLAQGLRNGGRQIGMLERLLAMLLILINQPGGLGLLLAAKSILRFGEVKDSSHRKVAEYIIIGTFMSFGLAITTSILVRAGLLHWGGTWMQQNILQ